MSSINIILRLSEKYLTAMKMMKSYYVNTEPIPRVTTQSSYMVEEPLDFKYTDCLYTQCNDIDLDSKNI